MGIGNVHNSNKIVTVFYNCFEVVENYREAVV